MNVKSTTTALALIASFTIILLWIIAAPRPTAQQPEATPTQPTYTIQQREENNVTVAVTPLSLSPGSKPTFEIVFETHSVELDFDVPTVTALTDDQETSYGVASWEGSPPGGHHRNGTLTFAQLLPESFKQVTLTFTNISDVPVRTFSWTK